jgi:hypothetical protein
MLGVADPTSFASSHKFCNPCNTVPPDCPAISRSLVLGVKGTPLIASSEDFARETTGEGLLVSCIESSEVANCWIKCIEGAPSIASMEDAMEILLLLAVS